MRDIFEYKQYDSFTQKHGKLVDRLVTDVEVIAGINKRVVPGLWDTGATGTCISEDLANEFGLAPIQQKTIDTAGGETEANVYMIDVALPNKVCITEIPALGVNIGNQGIGVIIGMDIIRCGDFAVTGYNGDTFLSYRIPSKRHLDFAQESKADNLIAQRKIRSSQQNRVKRNRK